MSELSQDVTSAEREHISKPRGEVILGKIDPRTLSKEAFMHSPDLLWHGSGNEFTYDPSFDLEKNENENGVTLGLGFYATDRQDEAALYSMHRLDDETKHPIVQAFLPDHARMFDFRSAEDITVSAHVPPNMAQEYITYFAGRLKREYPQGNTGGLEGVVYDNNVKYFTSMKKIVEDKSLITVRNLLSQNGKKEVYGYAAGVFTDYMRHNGFDGVISTERGDHQDQKEPTSYVFYNLHKLGTYENWHPETIPHL